MGKIVSSNGVAVDAKNIETVCNWPVPKSRKELESFLGFANYHCDHVERYAALTELLHELASEKVDFVRWEEHQGAFDDLGEALTTPPILAYPDPESPFILDTDDSDKTISAELSQIQKDKVATICYASKVLTPAQRKYCTTRK